MSIRSGAPTGRAVRTHQERSRSAVCGACYPWAEHRANTAELIREQPVHSREEGCPGAAAIRSFGNHLPGDYRGQWYAPLPAVDRHFPAVDRHFAASSTRYLLGFRFEPDGAPVPSIQVLLLFRSLNRDLARAASIHIAGLVVLQPTGTSHRDRDDRR